MADRQVIADFARSMGIATSGLRAQAGRMRVISENIANADSTAPTAGVGRFARGARIHQAGKIGIGVGSDCW